jgi:D-alanyl-D-alanine carboxypeptidase/D-alanyl-D-alanine-endopeptidase (penicillin-binding protein 4)
VTAGRWRRVGRGLALGGAVLVSGACAAAARAPADTRAVAAIVDSIVRAPPLHRTHFGVLAVDRATGRTVHALNADRNFIPASNTKLVVALVALAELGPGFRYRTGLLADGAPGDSVARVLVARGSGDPTLSARFHGTDFAALDSLARQVRGAGIRHIGELVIDATRFDDARVNPAWEVGDLPFAYAAPTAAFAVAEGTFALERRPGPAPGEPAVLRVLGGDGLQPLVADVTTDPAGARVRWSVDLLSRRDTIGVRGALPAGAPPDTVRLAVANPAAYAGRALRLALARAGVAVHGDVVVLRDAAAGQGTAGDDGLRTVATLESPPLRDIVAAIQKPSQNWIAEQVVRTLGAERDGVGSWPAGLDVERRFLIDAVGLDSLAFHLRDASGLSPQNLLSPAAIVRLLEYARRTPWGEHYRAALPAPCETGGTLAGRLAGLEGRLLAKTGTIANVNALSGYLTTGDGRELSFSILTNASGVPAARVRDAIDAIVRALAAGGTQ